MPVYIEQRPGRTPTWVAEISVAGKRHRKRVSSRREGLQWCAMLKSGVVPPEHPTALTIEAAIAHCRRERSDWRASRDPSLGQRLEVIVAHFGVHTLLEAVGPAQLQGFVNTLRARDGRKGALSSSTINRYLAVLSAVFSHMKRSGRSSHEPVIPWQEKGQGRFEWLTREQEDALVRALPLPHGLIVRVLCATGLRAGELWSLKPAQIEPEWIRLWETKNGEPRSVPIDPSLSRPLRAMIADGIMPTYREHYRTFKSACASLGLSVSLNVHSMRHTTGTRLAAAVAGPVVQKFLGHTDYRTTQRYIHLADEDLRRASEHLKPSLTVIGRTA